jgi:hypothetical protein
VPEGEKAALPKIDPKNWPKTMDAMQDHFSTLLGKTKAPLAYVIHDKAAVPDEADNPPESYTMPKEEMICWMPKDFGRVFLWKTGVGFTTFRTCPACTPALCWPMQP